MFSRVVGGVKIVGIAREFGGDGINLLDEGYYLGFSPKLSDRQFSGLERLGDLTITEPILLSLPEERCRNGRNSFVPTERSKLEK